MPRSRSYIEGDIKAATRRLEHLQAELAATQPDSIDFTYGGRTLKFETHGDMPWVTFYEGASLEYRGGSYVEADNVPAVVAWLNYHFPAEAST